MITRLYTLVLTYILITSGQQAVGALLLTVDDTPSGVRLEYAGTLDVSGLSFSTSFGHSSLIGLRANDTIIHVPNDGLAKRHFDNPFLQFPANDFFSGNLVTFTPVGSTLLLDGGPHLTSTPLQLSESDITSEVWTGSGFMQFGNATLLPLLVP
jgi:hypothetical protein